MKNLLLEPNAEYLAIEVENVLSKGCCPARYAQGIGCVIRLAGCPIGEDACCPPVDLSNWPTVIIDIRRCDLCPGYYDLILTTQCEEFPLLRLHVGQALGVKSFRQSTSQCLPSITLCCEDTCEGSCAPAKRTYNIISQSPDGSIKVMVNDQCGPERGPCE